MQSDFFVHYALPPDRLPKGLREQLNILLSDKGRYHTLTLENGVQAEFMIKGPNPRMMILQQKTDFGCSCLFDFCGKSDCGDKKLAMVGIAESGEIQLAYAG